MKKLFQEVQVEKITDKIVDQLENLIKSGKLTPGDKLPSERQLIDMLGVGRSSLREALNKLETMGYIEIKKRQGIYIKSIQSTLQLDPLKRIMHTDRKKIVQLYEIRRDIEQASAHSAALERNDDDLLDIKKCLEPFTKGLKPDEFKWELDQAFHCAIAKATHNFFRIHVLKNIFDFSQEFIQPIIEGFATKVENTNTIARHHQEIFGAIKEQDADQARNIMKAHLEWTNQHLVEHFQKVSEKA